MAVDNTPQRNDGEDDAGYNQRLKDYYQQQFTQQQQEKTDKEYDDKMKGAVNGTTFDPGGVKDQDIGNYMAMSLYGQSSQGIGADASNYANMVKNRLGTDYAKADMMRQESGQRIAAGNAKAGLSGIDTTGANDQASRRGAMDAATANQDYHDKAMNLYGRNISSRQSGVSSLVTGGKGIANASTPGAIADYGVSVICTELYTQGKISKYEYLRSASYGYAISRHTYFGYLTIATPIVKLMKKSDKFSNLFIGWAKSIAAHKPNLLTRLIMPICFMVGYVREIKKEKNVRLFKA